MHPVNSRMSSFKMIHKVIQFSIGDTAILQCEVNRLYINTEKYMTSRQYIEVLTKITS